MNLKIQIQKPDSKPWGDPFAAKSSWMNKSHKLLLKPPPLIPWLNFPIANPTPSSSNRLSSQRINQQQPLNLRHYRHLSFLKMGLIFGKITVETPKFELIQSTDDYEIRKYEPSVVAEVTYDPTQFRGNRDGGFTVLAKYIGAIGEPQNIKSEKVAMTAPVITKSEKISMTAPVVTAGGGGSEGKPVTMQFVLPSKYKKAEEAPKPADESVVIREEGERKLAVVRFSGIATEGVVAQKVENLKKSLEKDGYKVIGDFVLARYNPPWTLPSLRTNEVMIPVE